MVEQIDEGFADNDLETNLVRDKLARLASTVNGLIEQLVPSSPDYALREACDGLVSSFILIRLAATT